MINFINSFWGAGGGIDLTDSLVSYWKLDEGADWASAGNAFVDSWGSNDGTATSVPDTAETNVDETANTPTDGDLLEISTVSGDFDFTNGGDTPFSVSFWNKVNGWGSFGCWWITRRTGSDFDWQCNYDSGVINFYIGDGTTSNFIRGHFNDPGLDDNVWHHYVFTYDGSESENGIEIYVDKVKQTLTRVEVGTYTGMTNASNEMSIGSRGVDTRARTGWHDEYKIWSKELDQAHVDADWANGDAGNPMF